VKVYESILAILEEKGSLPISRICAEVNQMLEMNRDRPLLPSQIKSIVTRKSDLFVNHEGNVSIQPDKQLLHLDFILDREGGISYRVDVNFSSKRFTFFEWRSKRANVPSPSARSRKAGTFSVFVQAVFSLKLWDWLPSYVKEEGIILGENSWRLKLVTAGKTYESEGTDCYPPNWLQFCRAIERLTGCILS